MTQTAPPATTAPAYEPPKLYCYRHPDRETLIRCSRCDRPICLQCQVRHPVGIRCKECAQIRKDPLTNLTAVQYGLAFVTALAGGVVGGFIAPFLGFFFAFFVGPVIGGGIAELVGRVIGYKRGLPLQIIVGGSIIAGVIIASFISLLVRTGGLPANRLSPEFLVPFIFSALASSIVYILFAIGGAISRLR